jgi:hypothetical protein
MPKESPQDEGPTEGRETPSIRPTLRRLGWIFDKWFARAAILVAKLWRCSVGIVARATSWSWQHRWDFWSGFFRLSTLLSVGYLVFDRIYETGASISSTGSDPKNPLYFPFALTNNSHIFRLRNIRWNCHFLDAQFGFLTLRNAGMSFGGTVAEIAPGNVVNVSCKRAVMGFPTPSKLSLRLEVQYDTNILGFTLHRVPSMLFSWAADSSVPMWIRGDILP